jgi:hypothetical protein
MWNREIVSGTNFKGYINGALLSNQSSGLQMTDYSAFDVVQVGAYSPSGYMAALNGDIVEIIVFNTHLNDAQRVIIDNYLSAKYNISITNDFYSGNHSTYIRDVQGIGTTDGTVANKHTQAANGNGLLLSELNNSLNAPNEFLFSGHASVSNSWINDPASGEFSRWERVWYLRKNGSIDANLSFDFSQSGVFPENYLENNLSNYKLVYCASASGPFTPVSGINGDLIPTLANEDQLTFSLTSTQLNNGYYTIAYSLSLNWTGAVSSQWDLPGNWDLNRIPTSTDHIFVNACTTCPVLSNSVSIAGIRLDNNSTLDLGNNTLSVSGSAYLYQTKMKSNQGRIQATDFAELKNSEFEGAITLEKTGGSNNSCYGGNIFSPELQVINSSSNALLVATQSENVIKNL